MYASVTTWLKDNGYGPIMRQQAVAGGCINKATRLIFNDSRSVFLKHNQQAPAQMFQAEASGLAALRQTGTLTTPEVLLAGDKFLLLEDLGWARPGDKFWEQLGAGLAQMHSVPQTCFGFSCDNYCGSTPQINTPTTDGFEFFACSRILVLAETALQRQLLDTGDFRALEKIAARLADWIPQQAPALIHGDLWSGNIHCTRSAGPALIDPACYRGWAEAELAMTLLFGGFDPIFYASYSGNSSVDADWRDRAPLYNLYHLLNHLLLFGSSYLTQVQAIIRRYSSA